MSFHSFFLTTSYHLFLPNNRTFLQTFLHLKKSAPQSPFSISPTIGIAAFIALYLIATQLYPGGSDFNKNAIGFSWTHNYWCNLLNTTAINGLSNAAQPVAIAAMIVLALSLALFWWIYASIPQFSVIQRKLLRGSAIASMLIAALLATSLPHDFIINAASLFGMIAVSLTLIGLYKSSWMLLLIWGLINILLVIANNVLYYNSDFIQFLPIVQKFSFASYLLWFSSINLKQKTLFN